MTIKYKRYKSDKMPQFLSEIDVMTKNEQELTNKLNHSISKLNPFLLEIENIKKEINVINQDINTVKKQKLSLFKSIKDEEEKISFFKVYKLRDWFPLKNMRWVSLCENTSPGAIRLLEDNLNRIRDWDRISRNSNAIHILMANKDKVDWKNFSCNESYHALKYLETNRCINWYNLCLNEQPYALKIIKDNFNKIEWQGLSRNKNPEARKILKDNIN
jgi:hypothetical protein